MPLSQSCNQCRHDLPRLEERPVANGRMITRHETTSLLQLISYSRVGDVTKAEFRSKGWAHYSHPPVNPARCKPVTRYGHCRISDHKNPDRWFSIMITIGPSLIPK